MSKKYTGHWCLRPSNVRVRYRADLHRKLSLWSVFRPRATGEWRAPPAWFATHQLSKALGVDGWAGILRRLSKRIADSAW